MAANEQYGAAAHSPSRNFMPMAWQPVLSLLDHAAVKERSALDGGYGRLAHMRAAAGCTLIVLFTQIPSAQTKPDVSEILRQVSDVYRSTQYEFYATAHLTKDTAAKPIRMHLAFQAPDRYRMEGLLPGLNSDNQESDAAVMVCDGVNLWMYMPASNEYGAIPMKDLTSDAGGDLGDVSPESIDRFMMGRYRGATRFAETELLREEAIEFGGRRIECYVVTVAVNKGGMAFVWWIDKSDHRILREDNGESSTVYTSIKLAEPLPDSIFKFEPPSGSRKIELPK